MRVSWTATETNQCVLNKAGVYSNKLISLCVANWDMEFLCLATKGLRKILRVSWAAMKTNECVLNKAGVKSNKFIRKMLGHTMLFHRMLFSDIY